MFTWPVLSPAYAVGLRDYATATLNQPPRYVTRARRTSSDICHYLHVERFARPGGILIGADSHTTTSGTVGMLATGAGGLDVAVCIAGQPLQFQAPRVAGVELRGRLSAWVQAKDVILELLRRRGVRKGLGRVFEFYGPGVVTMDVSQRMTICNMIVEMGATTGLFPSDDHARLASVAGAPAGLASPTG